MPDPTHTTHTTHAERIAAAAKSAAVRINERWTTDELDIAEFSERDAAIIVEELTTHLTPSGEVEEIRRVAEIVDDMLSRDMPSLFYDCRNDAEFHKNQTQGLRALQDFAMQIKAALSIPSPATEPRT